MLPDKLVVEVVDESNGRRLRIAIDRVLVVDVLPVPLHLSFKAIIEASEEADLDSEATDILYRAFQRRNPLEAHEFPSIYRQHAYWNDDGIHYIGMSNNYEDLRDALNEASGDDRVSRVSDTW